MSSGSQSYSADYWPEKLAVACRQSHIDSACLELIHNGSTISASYGHSVLQDDSSSNRYPVFCVAKLFTATLVSLLVMRGKLRYESEVTELLPATSTNDASGNVLHGITVSHLLSHSHGLGSIDVDVAPVNYDGFIDNEKLGSLLQEGGRIFAPGKFYSYGMAGYILLGCIIEHVTAETYREVLTREILLPISGTGTHLPDDHNSASSDLPICPSSGRGFNLVLRDLLVFAACFLTPSSGVLNLPNAFLAEIFTTRKLLPGWSPTISGCCYGWKNFAHNWYGHNGIDRRHLMYIRVNRATGTTICLSARSNERNPAALPSLLFHNTFPELAYSVAKQPRILAEVMTDSCHAIVGAFGNRLINFSIGVKNERWVVEIRLTGESKEVHRCWLYPAEENIFFLSKPWQNITFLQLVTDNTTTRYLWDHTQLWPEMTDQF